MKVAKRFYIAGQDILTSDYAKETLDEAVNSAAKRLASSPSLKRVVISQIVRVVTRATQPVIVEEVE